MLGANKPPEELGRYTGFLINWVAMRSREAFGRALRETGLKPPQFGVLTMIDAKPGITQNELVEATDVDPSTMVAHLDRMEADGLAERRPHPSDRRKRAVYLTDQGERTLRRAQEAAGEVAEQTFARLTDDERAELHVLLRKMTGLE